MEAGGQGLLGAFGGWGRELSLMNARERGHDGEIAVGKPLSPYRRVTHGLEKGQLWLPTCSFQPHHSSSLFP